MQFIWFFFSSLFCGGMKEEKKNTHTKFKMKLSIISNAIRCQKINLSFHSLPFRCVVGAEKKKKLRIWSKHLILFRQFCVSRRFIDFTSICSSFFCFLHSLDAVWSFRYTNFISEIPFRCICQYDRQGEKKRESQKAIHTNTKKARTR